VGPTAENNNNNIVFRCIEREREREREIGGKQKSGKVPI